MIHMPMGISLKSSQSLTPIASVAVSLGSSLIELTCMALFSNYRLNILAAFAKFITTHGILGVGLIHP